MFYILGDYFVPLSCHLSLMLCYIWRSGQLKLALNMVFCILALFTSIKPVEVYGSYLDCLKDEFASEVIEQYRLMLMSSSGCPYSPEERDKILSYFILHTSRYDS